ncbi:MAG: caspase family protein [Bryobacteraceae bacterium]
MKRDLALLLTVTAALAQQPSRDLVFEAAGDQAPPRVSIPRSYALVIGVSKYPKLVPEAQLLYAERDADEIYSTLISPEGGNFQNVRRLIGPKATLANIRKELEEWLPSVTGPDDRVLVYFAGHGYVDRGKAYLAPYDLDPAAIAATGYPMETLGRIFAGKIKGKWKVLLTDACHSGAIDPNADAPTLNRTLSSLDPSLFSFTASRDREVSYEHSSWGGGHGVFTYYVKAGLEGEADESGDGIVTADELVEYVRRNVREATKAAPRGPQTPTSDRGSFDPNMLLAYVAARVRPKAPAPAKNGTWIIETNMDGVEIFIDGKSAGVVNKGQPLRLPGLAPGAKTVQGFRQGYEPDGPREETVYPGQETTITIRIRFPVRRKKAAVDLFNQGLEFYNRGQPDNYRRAASLFQRALTGDPQYKEAALYLGRTFNALFDQDQAQKFLRRAIEIDGSYAEARTALGGMLLDTGNEDESIRQLTAAARSDPSSATTWYLLAQAFNMRDQYPQSIEAAHKAIAIAPHNAESHFWLAESLRRSGSYEESKKEYLQYLRLSNFDSKLLGKLNYHIGGWIYGKAKKKRASQHDIWEDLRSLAYFGLCDAERKLNRFDAAIPYCQRSLAYDPDDALTHYVAGLAYAGKGNESNRIEDFSAARRHLQKMLAINPSLAEADYARKNLASIEALLRQN